MNFLAKQKRRFSVKEKRHSRKQWECSAFADLPAIDKYGSGPALNIPQGITLKNGNVRILACFQ